MKNFLNKSNENIGNKVCIYHFTNAENLRRPIVYQKQMTILEEFASQYGEVQKIYLDGTLKQNMQKEREMLINEITNYDILIMKDFYHLAKNTSTCLGLLQSFALDGIKTITIEDGTFDFRFQDAPFEDRLKVCVYHSKYHEDGDRPIDTQLKIFNSFVKHYTNWKIVDAYVDEANSQSDSVQKEIFKVIENARQGKYDLLLIKNFNTFHWRTAKFCHRRNELALPIYSLKEGYLPYKKGDYDYGR